jgi:2-iminobutanoate/2-iminopropanoate deaminase
MNNANRSFLFLVLLMLSCNISKDKNDKNGNADIPKAELAVDLGKQVPIFTPSESPYPLSSAVQVGDVLYLSGLIADAGDGTGVVPGGIIPETHRIFERLKAILDRHGIGLDNVFKCTVFLADMSEWKKFNEVYANYFRVGNYPTRSAMGVNSLALGARVEIEFWAYKPQRNDR